MDNIELYTNEISCRELILKLKEWWLCLILQWRYILVGAFVGGIAGLTYAYLKKPLYVAELSFVVEEQTEDISNALLLASQFGIGSYWMLLTIFSIIPIIQINI